MLRQQLMAVGLWQHMEFGCCSRGHERVQRARLMLRQQTLRPAHERRQRAQCSARAARLTPCWRPPSWVMAAARQALCCAWVQQLWSMFQHCTSLACWLIRPWLTCIEMKCSGRYFAASLPLLLLKPHGHFCLAMARPPQRRRFMPYRHKMRWDSHGEVHGNPRLCGVYLCCGGVAARRVKPCSGRIKPWVATHILWPIPVMRIGNHRSVSKRARWPHQSAANHVCLRRPGDRMLQLLMPKQ